MKYDIRQIRKSEIDQVAQVYSNAFKGRLKDARKGLKSLDLSRTRAIFEKKRLVSLLQIVPFKIWIGGKLISMGGIGGVATWADRQGKGYAGSLMEDSIVQMRKRKMWVSGLYPFSYLYYGKFGWSLASHRVSYSCDMAEILPFKEERKLVTAERADDLELQADIYLKIARARYNLPAQRSDEQWKRHQKHLLDNNGQTYLIKDGKEYIGMFSCVNRKVEWGADSVTTDPLLLNPLAEKAMFGFLSTLPNKSIKLDCPSDLGLWLRFSDYYISTQIHPRMQFRVVDVEQALLGRGYREGTNASIVVRVRDEHAPWNEGSWLIEVKNARPIRAVKTEKPADASCSIQVFSQIFCGYRSASELVRDGQLDVKNTKAVKPLEELFFDKPTLIMEYF